MMMMMMMMTIIIIIIIIIIITTIMPLSENFRFKAIYFLYFFLTFLQ